MNLSDYKNKKFTKEELDYIKIRLQPLLSNIYINENNTEIGIETDSDLNRFILRELDTTLNKIDTINCEVMYRVIFPNKVRIYGIQKISR